MYGSFHLDTNELAIDVRMVQEVVNLPEKIMPVPLGPSYLLGIFNLRGIIIPVINLRDLLGLPGTFSPESKVAIVEQGETRIGLMVDRTGEILKNGHEEINAFHYGSGENRKRGVIAGAVKLDGGKRLVQILDIPALFALQGVPLGDPAQSSARDSGARLRKLQANRRQCISFQMGSARFGLGIDAIQEIIKVPEVQQSALTAGICLGMFQLRGDIVPVIDFAALLRQREPISAASVGEKDSRRIIVMKLGTERFGFLVDAVESIVTYYAEDTLPMPKLAQERASMFVGCLSREGTGEILLLDHQNILSQSEIHEITRGHSTLYQHAKDQAQGDAKKNRGARKTYITFQLGNLLGLEIGEVQEIINCPPPQELIQPPGWPSHIRGVINLRGKVITVIDGRTIYSLEPRPDGSGGQVLIFEKNGIHFGMIVDSVESILSFSEDEKIKLPDMFYKNSGSTSLGQDVKFAVEVQVGDQKRTLLILDLKPLTGRVGLSASSSPQAQLAG
jgi:purine-binding chemotaxis protein CheW